MQEKRTEPMSYPLKDPETPCRVIHSSHWTYGYMIHVLIILCWLYAAGSFSSCHGNARSCRPHVRSLER